jgi:aminoglycoside phosphotransferase (APT) family kinase protein
MPIVVRKPDVDPAAVDVLIRKVFGTSAPVTWERTPDGVSTQVYRLTRGAEVFYLRVAEQADENLETEAELHQRLRDLDVKVADVVHVEPFNAAIGRSTMITTEIPGAPLSPTSPPELARAVIEEAAADIAVINRQPVDGYGWIRRHGVGWPLRAEHRTYPSFLVADLPHPWPGPLTSLFSAAAIDAIAELIDQQRLQPSVDAHLAHGDFDLTAIFYANGRYTGLIDFGEIQGTEPLFDLGHFHLHDQEHHPTALLPALLHGYQQVLPLPADHVESIRRSAVLPGLRQLCRWLVLSGRRRLITDRVQRLNELIAQR